SARLGRRSQGRTSERNRGWTALPDVQVVAGDQTADAGTAQHLRRAVDGSSGLESELKLVEQPSCTSRGERHGITDDVGSAGQAAQRLVDRPPPGVLTEGGCRDDGGRAISLCVEPLPDSGPVTGRLLVAASSDGSPGEGWGRCKDDEDGGGADRAPTDPARRS